MDTVQEKVFRLNESVALLRAKTQNLTSAMEQPGVTQLSGLKAVVANAAILALLVDMDKFTRLLWGRPLFVPELEDEPQPAPAKLRRPAGI